ncbi:MAG: hypothetical protein EP312_06835 [Gammaproteobacteria bacterium]|nr:MAG: hypothetical protein EP312_06835 [Gammaproteobacteria bacterium]
MWCKGIHTTVRWGFSAGVLVTLLACQQLPSSEPELVRKNKTPVLPAACDCPEPAPAPVCPELPKAKPRATSCPPAGPLMPASLRNKMILGEAEFAYLETAEVKMRARIDSGAETSSLHAENIERFERDGESWVRFSTRSQEQAEPVVLELPVTRRLRIKSTNETLDRRPVVEVNVRIGKHTERIEVSLVDRGHFEFPLLIGRNFLKGIAVVDVSQAYIQGK